MPPCPNNNFHDGECIQMSTTGNKLPNHESQTELKKKLKSTATSSPFLCSNSSWCFDLEDLSPSTIFEWMGKKAESETGTTTTSDSTVDNCASNKGSFTARWPELSDPCQLAVTRCNIDPFDRYVILHETLLDGLLKEARHRKAGNSLQERKKVKDKRSRRSPITTRSVYSAYSHKNKTSLVMDSSFQSATPLLRKRSDQNKLSLRNCLRKRVKVSQLLYWKQRQKTSAIVATPNRTPKKDTRKLQASPDSICTHQSWSSNRKDSAAHFNVEVLYPGVHLQKDKGNGMPLGKEISAKGRNSVLHKLREKIDIMIEIETNKSSAVLKRTGAVGIQICDDTYETRSTIGVKMGFISMSYGILLQWKRDKMVHFICLRKMCTSAFMEEIKNLIKLNSKLSQSMSISPCESVSETDQKDQQQFKSALSQSPSEDSAVCSVDTKLLKYARNNHDNRVEGSKPNLLPPFLVRKPNSFPPATLEVIVLRARGLQTKRLSSKERWFNSYVRVSIGDSSFKTNIVHLSKNPIFGGCRGDQNHCILDCSKDTLKVEIFEWKPTARTRLIGLCHLPLSLVEPQPQTGNISAKEVTLPCKMVCVPEGPNGSIPFGSVSLSLIRRDDHAYWVKRELRERNRFKKNFRGWGRNASVK